MVKFVQGFNEKLDKAIVLLNSAYILTFIILWLFIKWYI